MVSRRYRLTLFAIAATGLVMVGCTGKSSTHPTAPASTKGATAPASGTTTGPRTGATAKPKAAAPSQPLPENTGIPACDDYLASYVACHRAAAVYAPDQIEPRYETMRDSLLRDSQNPATRPELGARCTSLALTLRQALHGKSCAQASPATPATPASTAGAHP